MRNYQLSYTKYEDGDDAIAKRAPRSIARSLLLRDASATYALIQSLLNYDDLLNRPTIPTLRDAQQTVDLIRSLLLYEENADVTDDENVLTALEAMVTAQQSRCPKCAWIYFIFSA